MDTHTLIIVAATAVITTISNLVGAAVFPPAKELMIRSTKTTVKRLFSSTSFPVTLNVLLSILAIFMLRWLVSSKSPITRGDVLSISLFAGSIMTSVANIGHYHGLRSALRGFKGAE